ncbi:MAG: hypothetical protein ACR2OO_10060, partial [Thermomicrobiales bacterium]
MREDGKIDGAEAETMRRFGEISRRDVVKSMLVAGGAVVFAGIGRAPGVAAQDKIRLSQWYHQYGEDGTQEATKRYAAQYTTENP